MADPLAPLNADQKALVSFSDGLNADGTLATTTGWRWDGNNPATYSNSGSAHKWGGGTAGTAGTVAYWIDPGSNWTPAEQGSFIASMTLWADIANITFTPAATFDDATFVMYRYGTSTPPPSGLQTGAYAIGYYTAGSPGDTALPATDAALMSIQTTNLWSDLASFTTNGGQGPGTVVHELGHVIGLYHTGPYNSNVDVLTQQYNQYDMMLWSTMSYITPNSTTTKHSAQYPVTGTNWGSTSDGELRESTTPMILDIAAAQQLYGVSTSTTYSGGQVFGFNCNITDASKAFYDFTVNVTPVVTIFDFGGNNTLDLSGYSTACTINLNPGTYSSFAGMTNNLGIAYGTRIDRAVGGSGDDLFVANSNSDVILGGDGTDVVRFSGLLAQYTLSRIDDVVTAIADSPTLGGTYTLTSIDRLQFSDQTIDTSSIACFASGTRIATPDGDVAVEDLAEGDLVLTAQGAAQAAIWIGHRHVDCTAHPRPGRVQPVRVRAGAFGPGLPVRDLLLSPDHAVFVDDVLVPIHRLVDGGAVARLPLPRVTYWHVELARHEVILAEGLPVESYLDTGNRSAFANAAVVTLHPDFAAGLHEGRCVPLTFTGPAITRLRARLASRAA